MLSQEENELFTRVGPGTPMGEVLRRYWHPVGCQRDRHQEAASASRCWARSWCSIAATAARRSLMQLRCAHRSLALDHGRVEGDCLRCPYHGWLYDEAGQCLEQPAEPEGSGFKEKIRLQAYPTQEISGLVFAYMGPAIRRRCCRSTTCCAWKTASRTCRCSNVNANWFNHVENIVDISHLAWLHGYTFPAYGAKKVHLSLGAHAPTAPTM